MPHILSEHLTPASPRAGGSRALFEAIARVHARLKEETELYERVGRMALDYDSD